MDEFRISRMYTDARISRIFAGSNEIMLAVERGEVQGVAFEPDLHGAAEQFWREASRHRIDRLDPLQLSDLGGCGDIVGMRHLQRAVVTLQLAADHALLQEMYQVKLVSDGAGGFTPELVATVAADKVAP